jgi:hypothetical protein
MIGDEEPTNERLRAEGPMNSHFSEDTLRENLDHLATWALATRRIEAVGRETCAEARFETDQTVQRMAYLAHLTHESTN